MREIIDKATINAINFYGDTATKKFYEFLKSKQFKTTKCKKCGKISWPPRPFCPNCFENEIEWIDIPKRGKVFSFTTQERALRFTQPDIIGFVEIEGIGRILTKIEGENISVGDEVEVDFIDLEGFTLHKFVKR